MSKLMQRAWLSLGFVVLAVASCDFPRLPALTGNTGDAGNTGEAGVAGDVGNTADAGSTGDAAAPGADARVTKQCTPVPGLVDDFNGAMNAALWETIADPNVRVSQPGRLEVALAPNQPGTAYGGYGTRTMRDFREHCLYVTFATVPTAASDMTIQFVSSTSLGFNVRNGQLVAYYNDGDYTPITSVTYDPVVHHVLRLRETGGRLFWETSPDGVTFAGMYSEPDRVDLSSIGIRIFAGTFGAQANPGTAVYDDLDTP
jgi:hypothetical protein